MDQAKFLEDFTHAYIVCALWSSTDDSGEPLDSHYDASDLSSEALVEMSSDCADFVQANWTDLQAYEDQIRYDPSHGSPADYAGHDFWLTRNGHGAGFWDRGLGELGQRLSDAAKVYGSCDIYAGDDGKLYV